jgi:type IV secretion system protein TrbB
MLRTALGPAIATFLEDPSIVQVMLNPDGRLWIDRLSGGLEDSGRVMSAADGERIVRLVAHHVGAEVHAGRETGERFEGLLPPVVTAPAFAIRKPAVAVFTLDDYVAAGTMTADQAALLREAVAARKNILVAGGTGTGKTTLTNAARRDRRHERSRRADRGYARATMPGAEPRRHAHQGRGGLALRSRALLAAAAARPHPDQ